MTRLEKSACQHSHCTPRNGFTAGTCANTGELEKIMTAAGEDGASAVRDASRLGDITSEMLRRTFPQWRVFEQGGAWWATRSGVQEWAGPRSLIQRVLVAADLAALAEKLCLQEYLDGLGPEELAAVYRDMLLPGTAR
jgi:hypothetical protein